MNWTSTAPTPDHAILRDAKVAAGMVLSGRFGALDDLEEMYGSISSLLDEGAAVAESHGDHRAAARLDRAFASLTGRPDGAQ